MSKFLLFIDTFAPRVYYQEALRIGFASLNSRPITTQTAIDVCAHGAGSLQFEAIHPSFDGYGRTGRIRSMLTLIQTGLLQLPILYCCSGSLLPCGSFAR